jgi:2-iminobutanoate/2-iminopropanoate deaminase
MGMNKSTIYTDKAPKPGPSISQAVRIGNLLFTEGVVGRDPQTGELASDEIRGQTRQVLNSIEAILERAGTSLRNVIKVNAYVRDITRDIEAFNEVYRDFFDPENAPARTIVQVGNFRGKVVVEIDVIAHVTDG